MDKVQAARDAAAVATAKANRLSLCYGLERALNIQTKTFSRLGKYLKT